MDPSPDSGKSVKLKIALATDWYLPRWGGTELGVHKLAKQLQAQGHEVHVVTTIPGPDEVDGVKVHRIKTLRFPKYHFALSTRIFPQIREVFRRENYDLVHCHGSSVPPVASGSVVIAQDMGIPCVCTIRSLVGNYQFIMKIFDWFLGWTEYPVVYSGNCEMVAGQLRRWMGRDKVKVLSNGLDPAEWLLPRQDAKSGEVRIASVMRVTRRKRPVEFVKMVAQVRDRLPAGIRLRVFIVGDGPAHNKVMRQVRRLGLEGVVTITGFVDKAEVKKILSQSDIYVQPTIVEAFGNAALEARAAGLPVIARAQGGIKEFICDGREGFIVPSDGAMVDRMVELATDAKKRQNMMDYNRAHPPVINWDTVLEAHHRIYHEAIQMMAARKVLETTPAVVPEESASF